MIERDTVISNVRNSSSQILKFLGYARRTPPKVIVRKIDEELEKFQEYIDIEYGYRIYKDCEAKYANVVYTIGGRLEEVINSYIQGGEAMRAMIMDKIGVVTLDEIKGSIIDEIFMEHGLNVVREVYPGSIKHPLEMQKEILEDIENIKSISINEYFQLYPVKTVALKMLLSDENKFYNPCEDCENICEAFKVTEEEAYNYFREKSKDYTRKLYEKEGIPEEVYKDNMKDLDIWSSKYEKVHGIKGFYKEQFEWIDSILEMKVIKLGRLQFELLQLEVQDEVTKLALKDLEDFILVNVHIRESGDKEIPFTEEECDKSYNMAKKYYKDRGQRFSRIVFICNSWLINPDLAKLLTKGSNIMNFQERYNVISIDMEEGSSQIIERVLGNADKGLEGEGLTKGTSLQVRLKELLSKGHSFPKAKGYFIFE